MPFERGRSLEVVGNRRGCLLIWLVLWCCGQNSLKQLEHLLPGVAGSFGVVAIALVAEKAVLGTGVAKDLVGHTMVF